LSFLRRGTFELEKELAASLARPGGNITGLPIIAPERDLLKQTPP
jgi:hypothetical protein